MASTVMAQDFPPAAIPDSELRYLESPYGRQQNYELSIALPRGYGDTDRRYPVLYVLDSNGQFGTVVEAVRALATYDLSIPQLIVVGVGYPVGAYYYTQPHRQLDYTPRRNREWELQVQENYPEPIVTGGGTDFRRFLGEVLIPFIDRHYRTSTNDRGLYGYSQGGLFAFDTLLEQPGLFQRYIIGSPNLGYDNNAVFEKEENYSRRHRSLPARLFISSGVNDVVVFDSTDMMIRTLDRRNYDGLNWSYHLFPGEVHDSAIGATVSRGLRAVYDPPQGAGQ